MFSYAERMIVMEIEHINEKTIRVSIHKEDLEARGIEFLDLLGNQQQVESFFHSILEEIDETNEFSQSDSVTFQVIPNGEGLDLLISQHDFEDEEEIEQYDESLQRFLKAFKEKKQKTKTSERPKPVSTGKSADNYYSNRDYVVYVTPSIEEMIAIAQDIDDSQLDSTLFAVEGAYFVRIVFDQDGLNEEHKTAIELVLGEYAEPSRLSEEWLIEHAQTLIAKDALGALRRYFN